MQWYGRSQIGKSQNKKALYCMIQFTWLSYEHKLFWLSYKHKTVVTENKPMAILGRQCLGRKMKQFLSVGEVLYLAVSGSHKTEYI